MRTASAWRARNLRALSPGLRRSISTSSTPDIYDVVCIGGGPAGLSLLSALKTFPTTKHLKVALLDSQPLRPTNIDPQSTTYSNRCSSLTPASVRFLRKIGAHDHLVEGRLQPYQGMQVWDGVSGSRIQFDSEDGSRASFLDSLAAVAIGKRSGASTSAASSAAGERVVATMCENVNLTTALLQSLGTHDTLTIMDKTQVESIELGPEPTDQGSTNLSQWPVIRTDHGRIAARLLVGADGANSPVRAFADIPSHGWDYGQHGVVATLSTDQNFSRSDLRTAYQRFLPTGSVALLPLPDNKATLVWSTTPILANRLKQLPPQDFVAMINAAFRLLPIDINYILTQQSSAAADEVEWRESSTSHRETGLPASFPRIESVQEGSVASFPLRMRHASTYTGHRVALIGDAAHTMHPLAGQGLNLGLADAEALAARIAYGVEHGMDIGSCWCLDGYNADRWAANNAMLGVVDKLQKLYSVESGPLVWGRSLGLDLVNKLGPVKGMLMRAAAGTS